MIGKVACALLLLSFCRADVDTYDLKDDIVAAQTKVKNMSENSIRSVQEINKNLLETSNYFNSSVNKYLIEGESIYNTTQESLEILTNKYVGEAIDKNKPVNTFKCILRVNMETKNTIDDDCKTTRSCVWGVFTRQNNELDNLLMQLDLIQKATTGLYDVIYGKLAECKTSNAVAQLVQEAEVRENNLKKLIRVYLERGSDFRIQYNEGQLSCMRSAQGFADNTLKICGNKMKAC